MKKALITGITGQDGSYLTELLMAKGYEVHGIIRRASSFNTHRIDHLYEDQLEGHPRMILHYGDMTDSSNLNRLIEKVQPSEIYNLAAQSHVQVSFEVPEYTAEADAIGVLRILDAIRETGIDARFYQASTSELYGKVMEVPQTETTPFYPRSPYAVAKQYGFWIVKNYRESYGLHASNGILFNHESPRRGETFVTRKITMAVARISRGLQKCLYMGNINAFRDWGYGLARREFREQTVAERESWILGNKEQDAALSVEDNARAIEPGYDVMTADQRGSVCQSIETLAGHCAGTEQVRESN